MMSGKVNHLIILGIVLGLFCLWPAPAPIEDTVFDPADYFDERDIRENCRLLGITLYRPGPEEQLLSILDRYSHPFYQQRSGWSLAVYSEYQDGGFISEPGKPMIIRSERNISNDRELYDSVSEFMVRLQPNVIFGHLRNATSGCTNVANPHPFQRSYRSRQLLMTHNGGVWGDDLKYVQDVLLEGKAEPMSCPDTPIDSEFLFLYLLKILEHRNVGIFEACQIWGATLLQNLEGQWSALNILLTDGEALWAVRISTWDTSFFLHYKFLEEFLGYGVSTQSLGGGGWTLLPNYSVAEFRPGQLPRIERLPYMPGLDPWTPGQVGEIQN